ncbi:hypothetical protein VIGAN_11070800 [Vigna angularis var. angularis]|uniref:Uncharacterized protein n=1 Tax=Vigna angularis var. angularis TaxID=157739 RepID=A0A0S3T8Z3_PHAAN|nr:hypothetical protein VIGAN_11070800 [Vigna angularis var. angularis]
MEEVEMAEHKVTESCSSNTREPSICIKKAEEEEVESLEKKLPDLFGYYKEFMAEKVEINLSSQWSGSGDDLFEDLVSFMLTTFRSRSWLTRSTID